MHPQTRPGPTRTASHPRRPATHVTRSISEDAAAAFTLKMEALQARDRLLHCAEQKQRLVQGFTHKRGPFGVLGDDSKAVLSEVFAAVPCDDADSYYFKQPLRRLLDFQVYAHRPLSLEHKLQLRDIALRALEARPDEPALRKMLGWVLDYYGCSNGQL